MIQSSEQLSIEQLTEVIVQECKRACKKAVRTYTNNRDRAQTMADDMCSEVEVNVYFQLLDKPEYWNLKGVRSTINLYIKQHQRSEGREAKRTEIYADLHGEVTELSFDPQFSKINIAMFEIAADLEKASTGERNVTDFYTSSFYHALSAVERAVLELRADDVPMKKIAETLGVSINVPRNAINRIAQKAIAHGIEDLF